MFQAYLDESGTHKEASLVVVAGWVGSGKSWKYFIREWKSHLKNAHISYFHAKDPRCESLKVPLARIILKRNLHGVAWLVNSLDFKNNTSQKFRSKFGNAYSTCAFLCAGLISKLAKEHGWGSIALVYEAGQSNTDFVFRIMNAIIEEKEYHKINSINFLNKKDPGAIPLQAADFLSHVISTNETKWIKKFEDSGKLDFAIMKPPEKIQRNFKKNRTHNRSTA